METFAEDISTALTLDNLDLTIFETTQERSTEEIIHIQDFTIGNKYLIEFYDDEASDRVEEEFAPVYDGVYICTKINTLQETENYNERTYVEMQHIVTEECIYVLDEGYLVAADKPCWFCIPTYCDGVTGEITPLDIPDPILDEDEMYPNAEYFDNHYEYCNCVIRLVKS